MYNLTIAAGVVHFDWNKTDPSNMLTNG